MAEADHHLDLIAEEQCSSQSELIMDILPHHIQDEDMNLQSLETNDAAMLLAAEVDSTLGNQSQADGFKGSEREQDVHDAVDAERKTDALVLEKAVIDEDAVKCRDRNATAENETKKMLDPEQVTHVKSDGDGIVWFESETESKTQTEKEAEKEMEIEMETDQDLSTKQDDEALDFPPLSSLADLVQTHDHKTEHQSSSDGPFEDAQELNSSPADVASSGSVSLPQPQFQPRNANCQFLKRAAEDVVPDGGIEPDLKQQKLDDDKIDTSRLPVECQMESIHGNSTEDDMKRESDVINSETTAADIASTNKRRSAASNTFDEENDNTTVSLQNSTAGVNQIKEDADSKTLLGTEALAETEQQILAQRQLDTENIVQRFLGHFQLVGSDTYAIQLAASQGLASVLQFAMDFSKESRESREQSDKRQQQHQATIQWLTEGLQESNDICAETAGNLEKYKKSKSQKEIRKEIDETRKELGKLRAPDVTLEGMKKEMKALTARVQKAETKVDEYKSAWATEKKKLQECRTKFNKEHVNRKDVIKEFKRDFHDLEARVGQWTEEPSEDSVTGRAKKMRKNRFHDDVFDLRSPDRSLEGEFDSRYASAEKLAQIEVSLGDSISELAGKHNLVQSDIDILRSHFSENNQKRMNNQATEIPVPPTEAEGCVLTSTLLDYLHVGKAKEVSITTLVSEPSEVLPARTSLASLSNAAKFAGLASVEAQAKLNNAIFKTICAEKDTFGVLPENIPPVTKTF